VETIKFCVKGVISPKDKALQVLQKEFKNYKKVLIPRVQKAVRKVAKDRSIKVYAQQKWMLDKKLTEYVKNLPFHPMAFHNQSVRLEKTEKEQFYIHFKTRQEEKEAVCHLQVPMKYRNQIEKACGKDNPILGQVELIEDKKYGWINVHITLRLPKPEPYEPEGWIGVDVGWNKLATSILATANPHLNFTNPTVYGKDFKTRIIQLKYLLKDYARNGRAWKKWDFRLKHTVKNAVGTVAKEIVTKAVKHKAGVAMENLTFQSQTKRWLIPRYKLMVAVKTLCERKGVPFKLVPPRNTSITCPKCRYIDAENRKGERFTCRKCGYQADADIVAAMNIATIGIGFTPLPKEVRLNAEASGDVATPLSTDGADDLYKGRCKPNIIEKG
jgi:transposase